jgi:threonine dehydrogenase-like Zn-dependent dehydrogenase
VAVSRAAADRRVDADGARICGIVEEVGSAVKSIKPGQFVSGSFATSDNTCPHCLYGYQSSCMHREFMNRAQAPVLRVPLADGTLVPTPDLPSDDLLPSLLTTSDVLGTGWFPAHAANVKPGSLHCNERSKRATEADLALPLFLR